MTRKSSIHWDQDNLTNIDRVINSEEPKNNQRRNRRVYPSRISKTG